MANKNTRVKRRLQRLGRKQKMDAISMSIPVRNYHSAPNKMSLMTQVNVPTGYIVAKEGENVISQNKRRNMQQTVYVWADGSKKISKTQHEKIIPAKECFPKARRDGRLIRGNNGPQTTTEQPVATGVSE